MNCTMNPRNAARRVFPLRRAALLGAAWAAIGVAGAPAVAQPVSQSVAPAPTATHAAQSADADLVKRGAYLARAGDCVACHTASGGKPFAGGLKFDTPIGAIYSTNITPDRNTGVGGWTLDDFARAVREGVRKNGDTMYPAMPYPSYSRLSDDDVKALYAYFMHG
ncbi:c-type cytochrome, partial [Burkholderia vietnamiensis]|uniref:c-type cytochrome n=1 Tax=Burkholderia vietnamiensis TaxID=60552 RepID=UPI003FEFE602